MSWRQCPAVAPNQAQTDEVAGCCLASRNNPETALETMKVVTEDWRREEARKSWVLASGCADAQEQVTPLPRPANTPTEATAVSTSHLRSREWTIGRRTCGWRCNSFSSGARLVGDLPFEAKHGIEKTIQGTQCLSCPACATRDVDSNMDSQHPPRSRAGPDGMTVTTLRTSYSTAGAGSERRLPLYGQQSMNAKHKDELWVTTAQPTL